jgi:hypothetical protein
MLGGRAGNRQCGNAQAASAYVFGSHDHACTCTRRCRLQWTVLVGVVGRLKVPKGDGPPQVPPKA